MLEENLTINKVRIFLGICNLYKGGVLEIPIDLYQPMFLHLATEAKVTPK